jgi:outer membrane protein assembly factor BamB
LLCLDPATGQTLWERERVEAVHLLGVGSGRLILTTPKGIRAVRAADGSDAGGWVRPDYIDTVGLPSWGRGFLAGKWVFWPTAGGVKVLGQEDGQAPDDLIPLHSHNLPPGNMAYAAGCLAVADTRELAIYLAPARTLPRREGEARDNPNWSPDRYRLAEAEADAGLLDRAAANFRQAAELAGTGRVWQGRPLSELALRGRHEALLRKAGRAAGDGLTADADALLDSAAAAEFPAGARAEALARRAALWTAAGRPERALSAWQAVLADDGLRQGTLRDGRGLPQRAEVVAAERVRDLIGEPLRAAREQQAGSLLAAARGPAELERVASEYPCSAASSAALVRLGKLHEEAGRWGAAAHAYRRFLARAEKEAQRPAALAGLARAWERQQCWDAARDAWEALAREDAGEREFVARQLDRPAYREAPAPPDAPPPLALAWEVSGGESFLGPCGTSPDLLFGRGEEVVCRDGATGKGRWRRGLGYAPDWAGCYADVVLAAGPGGVTALALQDGERLWTFHAPRTPVLGGAGLSGFRQAGPRLFCLEGESRLLALDAAGGRVLWDCWAPCARIDTNLPGGRFSPHYVADDGWVLVQTAGRCWALEAATGRRLHEFAAGEEPWPQPPLPLDGGRVACVPDAGRVAVLDVPARRTVCSYRLPRPLSLTGEPPQVHGGRDVLLVVIPRNYAYTLQRIDPETGRSLWPEEVLLGPHPVGAASLVADRERVWYAAGEVLTARASGDGRVLWEQPLGGPSLGWRLLRAPSALAAWPAAARRAKLHFCWQAASVESTVTRPPESGPGRGLPVLLFDPKTGQETQRLGLEAPLPRVRFRPGPDEAPGLPRLRVGPFAPDGEGPSARLTRAGLVVAWGGQAWALRTEKHQ